MLWDCKYCGQTKLLGLTHRFCAKCGAPQDASKRYFPPDDEKVAVQDHPFVGADLQCPACHAWNGRAAAHCTNCGGPLAQGASAPLVAAPGGATFAAPAPPPKKSTSPIPFVVLGVLVLVVGLVATLLLWKKGGAFEVAARTWERTIDVERFGPVHRSAWCDEMPAGTRSVSHHMEQRSSRKIPDGQTCTKKKKDNGDGTYKEITECAPKYKDEPVMGDKCDFDVDEWKTARSVSASGGAKDEPKWPALDLHPVPREREGARREKYTVTLRDVAAGKTHTCNFDQPARWSGLKDGARYEGKMGALTGMLDCDSLQAE
jgi:hypothetical protein